jgi:hypothetical protein
MAMSTKEKLLLVWILGVVAIAFLFSHFCDSAVYALGKIVALGLFSFPGLAKFAVGIFGVAFWP